MSADLEQLLRRVLVAFNEHDLDAIVSHFAEDCVLEIPRGPDRWGCRFVGREEVRRGDFVFRRRPLASRRTPRPVQLRLVFSYGNDASRTFPAGGRRNLPPIPANPRNARVERPCSRRKFPPIPAQPGSTMTGLSRRSSRVRVPSLPSLKVPANRHVVLPVVAPLRLCRGCTCDETGVRSGQKRNARSDA